MAKNMFSLKKNIANMVTVSNAVFGITSIFFTISGNYSYAAILIFLAIALDILDGEIARGLNITSELGSQLDSLSDLVTFGIATAVLAYVSIFNTSILGAVVSAILVLCGIYRLARFNVVKKQKTFTGLPIPAMAAIVSSFVIAGNILSQEIMALFFILLSYLMISKTTYPIIKHMRVRERKLFVVFGFVVVLFVFAFGATFTLSAVFVYYALLGWVVSRKQQ